MDLQGAELRALRGLGELISDGQAHLHRSRVSADIRGSAVGVRCACLSGHLWLCPTWPLQCVRLLRRRVVLPTGATGCVGEWRPLITTDGKLAGALNSKTLRVGASVGVLVGLMLIGTGVRIAPHLEYYSIPGAYRAFSVYDISHVLVTGHEIRPGEVGPVTSYSSGIYLGTEDILRHKLEAAVMLLMGLDETSMEAYYRFALWSPVVAFPLMVLAIYFAMARASGARTTKWARCCWQPSHLLAASRCSQ